MGEKFLKTAKSRARAVVIAMAIIILTPVVMMIVTVATTDEKALKSSVALAVWTRISQAVIFVGVVSIGIITLVLVLSLLVTFLFGVNERFMGSPVPFKTLRDQSKRYNAVILKVRDGFIAFGRTLRKPFRKLYHTIEDWIDRGDAPEQ